MSRPEEMPDGDDEWPEATDGASNDDADDPDLLWFVDGDEGEEEEDEEHSEDGDDERQARLDNAEPELAQFAQLFSQARSRHRLFKSGFTVHLNRSARDEFERTSKELKRVAELRGQRKITDFVSVDTEDEMEKAIGAVLFGAARKRTTLYTPANLMKAISALIPLADINKNKRKTAQFLKEHDIYHKMQAMALLKYFQLIVQEDKTQMEASATAAWAIYNKKGEDSYKAKCIREWARHFLCTQKLWSHKQGLHVKTFSVIYDENVQMTLRTYLRAMKPEERYPSTFIAALNTKLLKEIPRAPETVSLRTALRWMNKLGFFKTKATKGWFTDGHERWDVVRDRKAFVVHMLPRLARMRWWEEDADGHMTVEKERSDSATN